MCCCIYFLKKKNREVSLGGGISIGVGASVIVLFSLKQLFLRNFVIKV